MTGNIILRVTYSVSHVTSLMEQTVILIKPDGMKQRVIGKAIERFEGAGFKLIAAKLVWLTDELLNEWYVHHKDKDFFPGLVAFMKETPVLAMIWEGENVVAGVREIAGPTDPQKAPKGTLRGDFGTENPRNIIHASDNPQTVEKEKNLIFTPDEIIKW